MKAIVVSKFGDERVLELQEVPVPEPETGQVRVRLKAAGVNPVETYIRAGTYGSLPRLPYTPGNDGAGVVDAVGSDVSGLAAGQRVFVAAALAQRNTGTYAEQVVCDANAVRPLPQNCTFAEGAGLGTPGLAAANALFGKAALQPGETVLVQGATGGVGSIAVQLARKLGAVVLGTTGSAEGERLLTELGVHQVFNHREKGYPDRIREAAAAGPDVILEVLANVNLTADLALLAKHGRIVVVGSRGSLDFNPRDTMAKDATICGMLLTNMTQACFREHMHRLSAALENGLRVIVGRELPLAQAAQAHKDVISDHKAGKIVLLTGQA